MRYAAAALQRNDTRCGENAKAPRCAANAPCRFTRQVPQCRLLKAPDDYTAAVYSTRDEAQTSRYSAALAALMLCYAPPHCHARVAPRWRRRRPTRCFRAPPRYASAAYVMFYRRQATPIKRVVCYARCRRTPAAGAFDDAALPRKAAVCAICCRGLPERQRAYYAATHARRRR